MNEYDWTDGKFIMELGKAARLYNKVCGNNLLYISIPQKANDIFMLEASYEPVNFQHLCGIESKTKSALDFYFCCLNNNVTLADCSPSKGHNRKDMAEKIASLQAVISMPNMKGFHIGKRITGNVLFDYGIGQNNFIGYKYISGLNFFVPYTNISDNINKFCIDLKRVSIVLSKKLGEEYYDKIEYEASKNLLTKVDEGIKDALSGYIMGNLLGREELQREQEKFLLGEDELESVVSEENPLVK